MTPARLAVPLVLAASLGLGGAAVAGVLPTLDRASADPTPAPVVRAHAFVKTGPGASYEGDSGGLLVIDPVVVEVPDDATRYDAVVTVSFHYATSGPGPFKVSLGMRESGDGPRARVRPGGSQPLRAAGRGDTTTVRYLVTGLAGGTSYDIELGANSTSPRRGSNEISTGRVLVTAELTPR